jgi:hypothetical protein
MGGYGSTRWSFHDKKQTVEACLRIRISDVIGLRIEREAFTQPCETVAQGSIRWGLGHQRYASVGVGFTNTDGRTPILQLFYAIEGQRIHQRINFTSTPCYYGGKRWWFSCANCGRRAGVIYLPPGARRFACRTCHNLAYTSAQTAHEADRGTMASLKIAVNQMVRLRRLYDQVVTMRESKRKRRVVAKIQALESKLARRW